MRAVWRFPVWWLKTRTRFGCAVAAFIFCALAVTDILGRLGEPRWEAKPLRYWVRKWSDDRTGAEAIQRIGEQAVPFLMARLDTNRVIIPRWARFVPERIKFDEYLFLREQVRQGEAFEALQTLGPKAKSALPELYSRIEYRRMGDEFRAVISAVETDPEQVLARVRHRSSRTLAWALELQVRRYGTHKRLKQSGHCARSRRVWCVTQRRTPCCVNQWTWRLANRY